MCRGYTKLYWSIPVSEIPSSVPFAQGDGFFFLYFFLSASTRTGIRLVVQSVRITHGRVSFLPHYLSVSRLIPNEPSRESEKTNDRLLALPPLLLHLPPPPRPSFHTGQLAFPLTVTAHPSRSRYATIAKFRVNIVYAELGASTLRVVNITRN